ncbi:MAG: V-type ATP synthase subunit D [Spirochaetia bacterium]
MADQNLPPTKNNLRIVKDELEFATLGYDLLDQKRNILVMEMMRLINQAAGFETKADQALEMAYRCLRETIVQSGRMHTLQLALAVNTRAEISLHTRKIMGVAIPVVNTKFTSFAPHYSSLGASSSMDESVIALQNALGLMGKLSELKIGIMRLAAEVKKTIRRVNALEKISIPSCHSLIKNIENRLEESERDVLILMKNVKRTLEMKEAQK